MKLQRITQAEKTLVRLETRLGTLLEREAHAELLHALAIVQEVRHFAVGFEDAALVEQTDPERAAQLREEAVTRLVQTLRPD